LQEYVHNGFKVGPNYARPPAPVAVHWIDAADRRVRTNSDDLSRWWTVFNDPALDVLVRSAYGQNLTLREAGFRVLQARAQRCIAVGSLFPQSQGASGDYTRYSQSSGVANQSLIPDRFYQQWDLGFGLAWELDFWGRYRRAIEAANADLDASVENYDDVLVTLLADAATAYVQFRTTERQIELAQANVKLQQETLKIAEARFKAKQINELDVDQATSTLKQTEALVAQLEINLRQANNRLCILMGLPPEDLRGKIGSTARIPTAPEEVAVGIPADLLRRRPDVRRAERQAAAESARIGVVESEFYPHITLNGNFGYSAEHIKDLFRPSAFTGNFGPSFQWALLNYGRILNSVRAQDAQFQQAVTAYQNTVLQAGGEVEDGLIVFLRAQERAARLAESVTAAQKAVNVALTQYKVGTVDFNRVALLEQNLVEQQDLLSEAQGQIALGLIQVYRALGGGWQIRCEARPEQVMANQTELPQPPVLPQPRLAPVPKP
jgi:NodT family efflux transporter outer membrane factor (OMF) lipoprotein